MKNIAQFRLEGDKNGKAITIYNGYTDGGYIPYGDKEEFRNNIEEDMTKWGWTMILCNADCITFAK